MDKDCCRYQRRLINGNAVDNVSAQSCTRLCGKSEESEEHCIAYHARRFSLIIFHQHSQSTPYISASLFLRIVPIIHIAILLIYPIHHRNEIYGGITKSPCHTLFSYHSFSSSCTSSFLNKIPELHFHKTTLSKPDVMIKHAKSAVVTPMHAKSAHSANPSRATHVI